MTIPASMRFVTRRFFGGTLCTMLTATAGGSALSRRATPQAIRPPADGFPWSGPSAAPYTTVEVATLNDYPVVLAHGIARFDFLVAHVLRNLALVGLSLEPAADGLHYFKGIGRHLRRHGFDVAHTHVSFAAGVDTRAADLQREITTLLQARGKRKVHVIAHSMGGLDATSHAGHVRHGRQGRQFDDDRDAPSGHEFR